MVRSSGRVVAVGIDPFLSQTDPKDGETRTFVTPSFFSVQCTKHSTNLMQATHSRCYWDRPYKECTYTSLLWTARTRAFLLLVSVLSSCLLSSSCVCACLYVCICVYICVCMHVSM